MPAAPSKESLTDAALLSAVRAGDETAMEALYDRYSGLVYSISLRVLRDTSGAEDLLQEIFLQLWRKPGSFDPSRSSLGPWLAVITRNRAIDMLRKRRPESSIEDLMIATPPDFADRVEQSWAADKIGDALIKMPPDQRKALEMAYFDGLTHSEIAAKTGEPLGTIKTRIRSGLLSLRRIFGT